MQYFIAMVDYGRRGREAVVDPEVTRTGMIALVRSGELKNIIFIHEVNDYGDGHMMVTDVTDEIMAEAGASEEITRFDHSAARADHIVSLRREA
jgi:hypothetical protein